MNGKRGTINSLPKQFTCLQKSNFVCEIVLNSQYYPGFGQIGEHVADHKIQKFVNQWIERSRMNFYYVYSTLDIRWLTQQSVIAS